MRILKSISIWIFLCSPVLFAASDVLKLRDVSQGAPGSRVMGHQATAKSASRVGFKDTGRNSRYPLAIVRVFSWNTFLGGPTNDYDYGIAVDTIGNVYVTGESDAAWGSPIHPYSGEADAFVAKFDASGALQWNTFLGGAKGDTSNGLAVDMIGNIYVTGKSDTTWGSPIRPSSGDVDAFVAKLDPSGKLQWNTFLGGAVSNGYGIAVDTIGNAYVTGESAMTWGSPILPPSGDVDAFVAKLNPSGKLQWNTFLGGAKEDKGNGLAVDSVGNIFLTGYSDATWGSPVQPYNYYDAFIAKLDPSGKLQWNTFLGGAISNGYGIAVDTIGNAYVTGESDATWGSPVRPHSGDGDAFIAKFDASGALRWNTFLGGAGIDSDWSITNGAGVAVDTDGNVFVTGSSDETWGSPIRAHSGRGDAFVAKLDTDGALQWNAFLGGADDDDGYGIAADAVGNIYMTGQSGGTWGSPIRAFRSGADGFVAKIKEGYNLTIASGSHGTTNPAPGTYFYNAKSTASVSAIADSEYVFDKWTGDVPAGQEVSATVSLLMNAQKSIQANFKLVNPPSYLTAVRLTNRSVTQTEYIIDLTWAANPDNAGLSITTYRVYQMSGGSWVKIADLSSNELGYRIRNVPKAEQTFGVASVTGGGVESAKITVVK